MSRLAIKEYLRARTIAAQAAIIANTQTFTAITVLRQTPKFEKLGTGLFIVMGPSTRQEERLSGSRQAGQKKATYHMRVWMYAVAKDEAQGGDDFDTAWENLLEAIRSMNVQVGITDPVTGAQSWLHEIGENIDDTVEEPKLSGNQGLVRFFGEALVVIEEVTNSQ